MVKKRAVEVLKIEAEGILQLAERLDHNFSCLVDLILATDGRVIVSGIGKSGIIGQKIVATLNSTGTRALFLHPVEAMHGDLGMVGPTDIVLALSNSGETDELNILIPNIRKIGCRVVAFTGNPDSSLAGQSDLVINVGVDREACPLGLAPTASTTALLAMGDALAVVLIDKKQINQHDFKKNHPGGALGQRLAEKVGNLMLERDAVPLVALDDDMSSVIAVIDRYKLGAAIVCDARDKVAGIITDGDLRRCLARKKPVIQLNAQDVMTANPRQCTPDSFVYDALNIMEAYQVTVLPVCDDNRIIRGVLHLHDILGKGAFKFNSV